MDEPEPDAVDGDVSAAPPAGDVTEPELPPSRFGAGYTVEGPQGSALTPPPLGWQTALPPTDPHSDYHRQAAQQFSGWSTPQPGPAGPSWASGSPVPPTPPPAAASSQPYPGASSGGPFVTPWNGGPPPGVYPTNAANSPYPYQAATSSDALIKRVMMICAAVVAGFVMLYFVRWFLIVVLFSTFGVVLILLGMAGVGGYLYYRNQSPQQARQLEARVVHGTRVAVGRAVNAVKTAWAATPTPPGWVPPAGGAAQFGGAATHPAGNMGVPTPPPPSNFASLPAFTPTPHHGYGPTPTASSDGGADAFKSALLIVPSLIAYAVVFKTTSFSSPWQPWWILTGLNVYFLICLIARARPGRGGGAIVFGLMGTVLIGLAISPSAKWSLTALLSKKQGYGDYTYATPSADLIPWISRAPVLAVLFFVVAWGVARRTQGSWVVGLIPAVLLVTISIWYREHEWTGESGWFGVWFMSVGVFVGGCLACWALDAMSTPRAANPPPIPPTW